MSDPQGDHGVEHEPHLSGDPARPDESEERADLTLGRRRPDPDREQAEHSVLNEPALLADVDGLEASDRPGYAAWLARQLETSSTARAWGIALLIALAGGPWAVLGAVLGTGGGPLAAVVWGPVTEEIMKVAILVTLLEIRPHLFTSRAQIHLAAMGSGLGFAVIENVIYLNVYIEDPPETLALWRWTICVALHVGCAFVASIGVAKMWRRCFTELKPPRIGTALRWLVAAIVIHGAYNAFALILELSGFEF